MHLSPSWLWRAVPCAVVASNRPSLRVPPPVTAEGKVVEPPHEKSFFEKYWMYIVIALLAMSTCFVRMSVSPLLTDTRAQPSRRLPLRRSREAAARVLEAADNAHAETDCFYMYCVRA